MSATPERLAWLREQLGGQIAEAPVAGEIFRPRGAWGDRPARLRRFVFRRLGMGQGLHELERGMGVLNLAVATQSRLHLFALRGRRGGIDVGDELVSWPLPGLELKTERRSVETTRFSGDAYTRHKSKILVLRIQPPGEPALRIDLAAGRDASALVSALRSLSQPSAGA